MDDAPTTPRGAGYDMTRVTEEGSAGSAGSGSKPPLSRGGSAVADAGLATIGSLAKIHSEARALVTL